MQIKFIVNQFLNMYCFALSEVSEARFNCPQGLCWLSSSVLAVCDTNNHAVRAVHLDEGTVEVLAGTGAQGEHGDLGMLYVVCCCMFFRTMTHQTTKNSTELMGRTFIKSVCKLSQILTNCWQSPLTKLFLGRFQPKSTKSQ